MLPTCELSCLTLRCRSLQRTTKSTTKMQQKATLHGESHPWPTCTPIPHGTDMYALTAHGVWHTTTCVRLIAVLQVAHEKTNMQLQKSLLRNVLASALVRLPFKPPECNLSTGLSFSASAWRGATDCTPRDERDERGRRMRVGCATWWDPGERPAHIDAPRGPAAAQPHSGG